MPAPQPAPVEPDDMWNAEPEQAPQEQGQQNNAPWGTYQNAAGTAAAACARAASLPSAMSSTNPCCGAEQKEQQAPPRQEQQPGSAMVKSAGPQDR